MPIDRALETLVRLGLAVSGRKGDLATAELSNGGRPQNDDRGGEELVGSFEKAAETSGRDGAMSETLAAPKDAPSEEVSDDVSNGSSARQIEDLGAESTGRQDLENGRANLDDQSETEVAIETADQGVRMKSEPEFVGRGGNVLDGQIGYRAVRTKGALPGLERRWLGLLMRPSVWALNKETH
jgi:hypothetical protein